MFHITKDTKSGSKIPLKIAIEKVLKENNKEVDKYVAKIEEINSQYKDLFYQVVNSKYTAILTLINNSYWINDINIFKEIITSNPNVNGFKPSVNKLSETDFQNLYEFLRLELQG